MNRKNPDPREGNALTFIRRMVVDQHLKWATKALAAGAAADLQLPVVMNDEVAVRALLVHYNHSYIGGLNRGLKKDGTGRVAEEVVTPGGTLEKEVMQLNLFEADLVILRKRDLAQGISFEADFLQACRDQAAKRAAFQGIDTTVTSVVIGDYLALDEVAEIRRRMSA